MKLKIKKRMDEIKYMVIYMDNSCEVHFDSNENSKLILSPCGSEFVYRTFSDNLIKSKSNYFIIRIKKYKIYNN